VNINGEKLILRLDHCVEAVFALEFDLPPDFYISDEDGKQTTQYAVLLLYDFKVLVDGLEDEFLVFGKEYDSFAQTGKLTKLKKRLREQKSKDIGTVRQCQLEAALAQLKQGQYTTDHFTKAAIKLFAKTAAMIILKNAVILRSMPSITDLKVSADKLEFNLQSSSETTDTLAVKITNLLLQPSDQSKYQFAVHLSRPIAYLDNSENNCLRTDRLNLKFADALDLKSVIRRI